MILLDVLKLKINRVVVVLIIVASGLGIPVYFLLDEGIFWPTPMQWLVIILYIVTVISFALMGAGVKGLNITSPETDQRIADRKSAFDRAMRPYLLAALVIALLWVGYLVFKLMQGTA